MFGRAALALAILPSLAGFSFAAEDGRTVQIIVSRAKQSLTVYDDGKIIATSKVSTGKPGHDTPTGIFSILEKRKYHESNIYSNAPMPWMQRLTWSGIALHEGKVPNYPASHGCVRLPSGFAETLFSMTKRGAHVIIADEDVAPVVVRHPFLFQLTTDVQILSDVPLRPSSKTTGPVELAMNNPDRSLLLPKPEPMVRTPEESQPLRILITRRGDRELVADVQAMLTELGFDAGAPDGFAGEMTRSAIAGFKRWKNLPSKGTLISKEMLAALYASAGRDPAPQGQLYIRQGFKEILSTPVAIRDPERELGTHLYTIADIDPKNGQAVWQAIALKNELSDGTRKRLGIAPEGSVVEAAGQSVLDRIEIPTQIRTKINGMLTEGTSITITDNGVSSETAPQGTDFITLTR
ncbi:L,D-transpeptidase family protein [Rhizobium sp. FKY42]|uniref:L,D-transpeptidase family protein n=1 Tax=Rhizobium sp. FKY42 TaxID=2562310 RepID=UPI0010C0FA1D|nr:L,D-transpeptidase family protein [Rhizobium sp. FKY42]